LWEDSGSTSWRGGANRRRRERAAQAGAVHGQIVEAGGPRVCGKTQDRLFGEAAQVEGVVNELRGPALRTAIGECTKRPPRSGDGLAAVAEQADEAAAQELAAGQVRKKRSVLQRAASPFGWWRRRAAALGVSQGSGAFGLRRAFRVNAGWQAACGSAGQTRRRVAAGRVTLCVVTAARSGSGCIFWFLSRWASGVLFE
jgi:hypothetical protein